MLIPRKKAEMPILEPSEEEQIKTEVTQKVANLAVEDPLYQPPKTRSKPIMKVKPPKAIKTSEDKAVEDNEELEEESFYD